jgi:hypothetical protein
MAIDIILVPGEPSPNDIRLQNSAPTIAASGPAGIYPGAGILGAYVETTLSLQPAGTSSMVFGVTAAAIAAKERFTGTSALRFGVTTAAVSEKQTFTGTGSMVFSKTLALANGKPWFIGTGSMAFSVSSSSLGVRIETPNMPSMPAPADHTTGFELDLSWLYSIRTLSVDIYFGTSPTPPLLIAGFVGNRYPMPITIPRTRYYWQIVAFNTYGSTTGPIWTFITPKAQGVIEMELSGRGNGWTVIYDVLKSPGISFHRGLPGAKILDVISDVGTLNFSLDNSEKNSAHQLGYYSPDNINRRAGFSLNIGVRYRIDRNIRFSGVLDAIDPVTGRHGPRSVACEVVDWMDTAARTRISNLPVLIDQHGDVVFQTLIDSLDVVAKPNAIEKDLSPDIFPYTLDRTRDEQTVLRDELYRLCVSGLDKCWLRGNGTLVYESRTRRSTSTTDLDTFTDSNGFVAKRDRTGVINRVQSTVHPRVPGTVSVILYLLYSPTLIVPGQVLTIVGPWTDPDNPSTRVGSVYLEPIIATTDYLVNSKADNSGVDLTANLSVSVGLSGNATQFTLSLSGALPGYILKLQQRGKPLYDYGATVIQDEDVGSIALYGLNILPIDMSYQSNPTFGLEVAQYIIHTSSVPVTEISGLVRFVDLENPLELARSINREISDRIRLIDEFTGIDRSFFINAIDESELDGVLKTEFLLAPFDSTAYWLLEVVGRSELDRTTTLGFGLIRGHIDIIHADIHSDYAHLDVTHGDIPHSDVAASYSHVDGAHFDGPAHGDVAHADYPHGDAHGDNPHSDGAHSDAAHGDSHTDIAHNDYTNHTVHQDSHTDQSFIDIGHWDDHADSHVDYYVPHSDGVEYNEVHYDSHEDEHGDVGGAYQPAVSSHGDVPFWDVHADQPHQDSGTSSPHGDVPHSDGVHSDGHSDIGHGDSHTDVAHGDGGHGDTHTDQAHNDIIHTDVLHTDIAHIDTHSDTAHGDA